LHPEDLDMDKPSFTSPDLDAFCLLDTLNLTITGQAVDVDQAVLECRTTSDDPDSWCHECGAEGVPRGTTVRRLVHVPLGWRPTLLHVRPSLPVPDLRARLAGRPHPSR